MADYRTKCRPELHPECGQYHFWAVL